MSVEQLILYVFVIFSVSIVPGPSMMLAFRDGALYRLIGTLPAAFGNMVASLMQALIAFLALKSIVFITPQAQGIIQIIGAGFICYIGYVFIRDGRKMRLDSSSLSTVSRGAHRRAIDGFIIAFFNPKAILFFIALFPQFTAEMKTEHLLDLLQTFGPIGAVALVCFLIYGALGQFSRRLFDNSNLFGTIMPILGGAMIAITLYISASYFIPLPF